ncbi:MAG: cytochrome c3 family protein [Candidatus Acidiferrales bacterium]
MSRAKAFGVVRAVRPISLFLALAAAIVGSGFLSSQSLFAQKKSSYWRLHGFDKYVTIPGATRVGSESCATCHADLHSNYRHAFHAQQGIECEDCHGAGSLHVDGGGDVAKIVSYRRRPSSDANGACLGCHAQDERIRNWLAGTHSSNHVRCVDCHQIHNRALQAANEGRISFDAATRGAFTAASVSPETNVILRSRSETNEACLKCHQTEGAQLSMPYHHPLREGKMSCGDCHDPHGGPAGNNLRTANVNQLCLGCHAQYRGPFAYQHPPVTENCMNCHTAHGSPNTNLLSVSEPALCLQCHTGHHNGASLPLADRCTNCHGSIHGTDVATPSGGSRFIDKGPSEAALLSSARTSSAIRTFHATISASAMSHQGLPPVSAYSAGVAGGALGMMSSGYLPPLSGGNMPGANSGPAGTEAQAAYSAYSITPGAYRFVDGSGFLGRVGEYDTLQQSAGADAVSAYVSTRNHLTVVSRANILTGDDYSAASQVTVGEWLQAGFNTRGFVQQQDHYPFYAFPRLDIFPGETTPRDTTTDLIPANTTFGVKRRMGDASARFKVPKLPVHLFVNGSWEARVGESQLAFLDENTLPITATTPCGALCHFSSQFQPVNYTTRNIGGGADIKLGQVLLTWKHYFSSFNDRLTFPIGTFTGPFTPESEGVSVVNPPPSGPAPADVSAGNYPLDIPSPNQSSSDSLNLNWAVSPKLTFNSQLSYTRLRNTFTRHPQKTFDSDETLNWHPIDRLQVTADYHQQNLINNFTPFYSLFGNVSYHDHSEGGRADYELPKGFDVEVHYKRSGITRSNAALWQQFDPAIFASYSSPSQIYSIDNSDLLKVVPSSSSNTTGLALRYHDIGHWSARAGYEWTGTHDPGYLIVPQSNNRVFADVWFTPTQRLVFANDISVILQNAFPAIPLLRPDGNGLSGDFQRRNRFYTETASATLRFVPGWDLGLGYSYQQNNLTTYMAFQNDAGPGYVVDQPALPYKQILQAYWGESTYTAKQRLGLNLRITYNSARSGFRPDVNPNDAAQLGNLALIQSGAFDPSGLFPAALSNLQFAATQVSGVIVPQWIGQSKAYYLFPRKFEGGLNFYYGSYRDYWNPNLNGVLRTFTIYVGRSW